MKLAAVALLSLLVTRAWATGPDLITIPERTQSANFQYLRAKNCSKIFFVPTNYELEREKSAVLAGTIRVDGSERKAIRIFISLKAKQLVPDDRERDTVMRWSNEIGGCTELNPQFEPYPEYMVDVLAPNVNSSSEVYAVKIERLGAGKKVLRMEIADNADALDNALEVLTDYNPLVNIQVINEVLLARSTLRASWEASAEFLKEIFYNRICYMRESWNWLGQKSTDEHCDYTPEVHVNIQKAEAKGVIEFEDYLNRTMPQSLLSELHIRLLSRMALSTFENINVAKLNELFRAELGDLKKSAHGSWQDTINQEELRTEYAGREIEISGIEAFVRENLTALTRTKRGKP